MTASTLVNVALVVMVLGWSCILLLGCILVLRRGLVLGLIRGFVILVLRPVVRGDLGMFMFMFMFIFPSMMVVGMFIVGIIVLEFSPQGRSDAGRPVFLEIGLRLAAI
jgi:hypothetical protein